MLTALKHHEAAERRGRLKIFFGAVAGVGKTYSMLESARATRAAGVDLVIGYVEPHGRLETERLVTGLEQLPLLEVEYRGIMRNEFDLDAALARHPTILVVDELAHSNVVDGSRSSATQNVGRTSRRFWPRASTSGPPSMFSIWKA